MLRPDVVNLIGTRTSTLRTDPLAAHLTWDEYTLTLTEHIYKDTTIIKLGVAYHTIQTGTAIMTLQKN